MNKIALLIAVPVSVAISGCAANWKHPSIPNPQAEARQLKIDKAYCQQVANGSAPMPTANIPMQSAQGYNVAGTSTTYGPGGVVQGRYNGSVTPTYAPATAFANGMGQGMAMGAMFRARQMQDEILEGCMMSLGWVDMP